MTEYERGYRQGIDDLVKQLEEVGETYILSNSIINIAAAHLKEEQKDDLHRNV